MLYLPSIYPLPCPHPSRPVPKPHWCPLPPPVAAQPVTSQATAPDLAVTCWQHLALSLGVTKRPKHSRPMTHKSASPEAQGSHREGRDWGRKIAGQFWGLRAKRGSEAAGSRGGERERDQKHIGFNKLCNKGEDFKKYISIYFISYKLCSSFCNVSLYCTREAPSASV